MFYGCVTTPPPLPPTSLSYRRVGEGGVLSRMKGNRTHCICHNYCSLQHEVIRSSFFSHPTLPNLFVIFCVLTFASCLFFFCQLFYCISIFLLCLVHPIVNWTCSSVFMYISSFRIVILRISVTYSLPSFSIFVGIWRLLFALIFAPILCIDSPSQL